MNRTTANENAFELFVPSLEENAYLAALDDRYKTVSLMCQEEREFLHAMILRNKPQKLLELGVCSGGSSVIMLNAIKEDPEAKLYCIDYASKCPHDTSREVGYMVEYYSELSAKRKLYTGGLALRFMEEIGGGIDFCLIDTVHSNPGEILDTLMVLPYLAEGTIIVYHDVNNHTCSGAEAPWMHFEKAITNNLLMSAVHGKKYIQGNFKRGSLYGGPIPSSPHFPSIGGIETNSETFRHNFELFNLLTLKWTYLPSISEEKEIISFFEKHYDKYRTEYLKEVFVYQREYPEEFEELSLLTTALPFIKNYWAKKL
jgi:predicted O-methyltransferase YrrM